MHDSTLCPQCLFSALTLCLVVFRFPFSLSFLSSFSYIFSLSFLSLYFVSLFPLFLLSFLSSFTIFLFSPSLFSLLYLFFSFSFRSTFPLFVLFSFSFLFSFLEIWSQPVLLLRAVNYRPSFRNSADTSSQIIFATEATLRFLPHPPGNV